jgi:phytoene synthase
MTRKTSFYYSFLALPKAERGALTAVFDFCRAVDDAVDLEPDTHRAVASLERWRQEVALVFDGEVPRTPQGAALQPFVALFHLPRAQFEALIDGVAMDATPRRYQTFAELEPYCHRVASSVGLMCAEIFGYRDPRVHDYARELGVALQLTNILRDVAVDFRRDRVYLPQDELARFGCAEADIRREIDHANGAVETPAVRQLLEFQAARAREYFARASALLPAADARRFVPAEIMRVIYFDLLRRIERGGFDVFSSVVRVPRPRQAALALRVWWTRR